MNDSSSRPYVLISTDAHAGADLLGYKPYLPKALHGEFDTWAADFHDPWADLDLDTHYEDSDVLMGRAFFVSRYSWESDTRGAHGPRGHRGGGGVPEHRAAVLPSGIITALAPQNTEEYRYRWAGIKAHNRWLVDFSAQLPGRRAGLAQVFVDDLDDAIAEMRWARTGLSGVLIPGDVGALYEPRYDRLWAASCDLGLPVHRHSIIVTEATTGFATAAAAVGAHEIMFWVGRAVSHLVLGGVFQRFPDLRFVITETGCAWVLPELQKLDGEIRFGKTPGQGHVVFGEAVDGLDLSATEYFQRNCWIGMSTVRPDELAVRHEIGVDRLMWGGDYPHTEGSFPNTRLALRLLFSDVPEDEVRVMTSTSAADVYGLDLDYLQTVANEIGPTVAEVATPVTPEELPQDSMSATIMSALAHGVL